MRTRVPAINTLWGWVTKQEQEMVHKDLVLSSLDEEEVRNSKMMNQSLVLIMTAQHMEESPMSGWLCCGRKEQYAN